MHENGTTRGPRQRLLKDKIARSFWDLGKVRQTLRDASLHIALGFERLEDMTAQRLGIARTVAWKLIAVAEQVPRAEAVALDQEAHALVAHRRALICRRVRRAGTSLSCNDRNRGARAQHRTIAKFSRALRGALPACTRRHIGLE